MRVVVAIASLCAGRAAAAVSQRWLSFAPPSAPGSVPGVTVTWTSGDIAGAERVWWGTTPGGPYLNAGPAPELDAYASPPILLAGVFGGPIQPVPYTSGTIHRATLSGLPPGGRVFYRIGTSASAPDASAEASFLAHPGVGPAIGVRLLALADVNVDCFSAVTGYVRGGCGARRAWRSRRPCGVARGGAWGGVARWIRCRPGIWVEVGVAADGRTRCFRPVPPLPCPPVHWQVCNPQAVIAAAASPRVLSTLTGGGLICGDLAYANGNQSHWDRWQGMMDTLTSALPVQVRRWV